MSVQDGSSTKFIVQLEALRGIAALAVAIGHSMIWLSIGFESAIWSKAIWEVHGVQARIARAIISVFSGAVAVDLFFVLSGFVLMRSLGGVQLSGKSVAVFVIKRLFRILPAFWFSLLVAATYIVTIYPGFATYEGASTWFANWYRDPLTTRLVLENALFRATTLNPNSWTLAIEILASLAMPFIAALLGSKSISRSAVVFIISVAFAIGFPTDTGSVVHYFYMFVIGAIVAQHSGDKSKVIRSIVAITCVGSLILASACFPLVHPMTADLVTVAGCAGIVWLLSTRTDRMGLGWLDSKWVRFLGKISYSFYLLHFVVLYAVANAMIRAIPAMLVVRWPLFVMLASCLISIAIAVPISALSFMWIERPFTVIGRQITASRALLARK